MSSTTDPNATQRASLKMAWGNLTQAMLTLSSAANSTSDPQTLTTIHYAYSAINSYSHLVMQAFFQTDNNLFVQETSYLKNQATLLQNAATQINSVVQAVGAVAAAVGFVAQAMSIIVAL
jgi:hypothetical protein